MGLLGICWALRWKFIGMMHYSAASILAHTVGVMNSKRASFAKDDETKECLTAKWHTGQDMCSVAASNVVFGNCANGSAYDLGKCLDGATPMLANRAH